MKTRNGIRILVLCVAGLLAQPFTAGAANRVWNNTSGGNFSDGANWSGGVAPGSSDNASFMSNATYTVTLTGSTNTVHAIFDASTAGNVTLDLGGYIWTNSLAVSVGSGNSGNSLTVQNGGKLFGHYFSVGNASSSNTLTVLSGTVEGGDELKVGSTATAHHNRLVINGSSAVCQMKNYDIWIGFDGYANSLLVTNGGKIIVPSNRSIRFGQSLTSSNNTGVVTGTGSLLQATSLTVGNSSPNNSLTLQDGALALAGTGRIGTGAGANGNSMLISGASWTNTAGCYVGSGGAHGNTLTLTNGAVVYCSGYGEVGNGSDSNTLTVADGTFSVPQRFVIGYRGTNNTVLVSGPNAVLRAPSWDIDIGYHPDGPGQVGTGNRLIVSNGGLVTTYAYYVGDLGGSNTILATDGGVLEATDRMVVRTNLANRIDNVGGVYQFTKYNPTITPYEFGNIGITNGSVSFRGIINADVFCNQSGKPLDSATKVAWSGSNGFRLNTATNNASGQAYTFQTGTATNFARLELLNGATYRGGLATFASGGSLIVSNGTSSIADVTMQTGTTLALPLNATNNYGKLVVTGTANLGGATLAVSLGAAPDQQGFEYVIIRKDSVNPVTGTFASSTIVPTFGGREYPLHVNYAGGDGNDVSLVYRPQGTLLMIK